jgi:hypothetical protein
MDGFKLFRVQNPFSFKTIPTTTRLRRRAAAVGTVSSCSFSAFAGPEGAFRLAKGSVGVNQRQWIN